MSISLLIKRLCFLVLMMLSINTDVLAQDAADPLIEKVTSPNNQLVTLLLIAIVVFALMIWLLSKILLVLAKQLVEKSKNTGNVIVILVTAVLVFSSQSTFGQDALVKDNVRVIPNYGGISQQSFYMFVAVLAIEIVALFFLTFFIWRIYTELVPEKKEVQEKVSRLREWWIGIGKRVVTKAVPVEKEADIMLDHDYDGIRELDNALPPWWKYGFYITIGIAIIYLLNFHVFATGKNPTEEYIAELETAEAEKEIYEAKNKDKIDENNIPLADANGLSKAKAIYEVKCWACHGKAGEGGAGPNLTDDYWLHNGSLNDIYKTIKVGYPDKGMQSWAKEYTPKEISFLASYVKKLHNTNPPNAKAPQGELYLTAPDAADSTDSIGFVKPDSILSIGSASMKMADPAKVKFLKQ